MMEKFYDTGYDYAGFDIYVGTGKGDPIYRDLPFIAQYDLIQDLKKGRVNLSAKSTLVHGASYGSMVYGAHYMSTKGFLEPALFNLRHAQYGIRRLQAQAMLHSARGAAVGLGRLMPGIAAGAFAAAIFTGTQELLQWLNPDMPAFGDMSGWTS